MDSKMHKNMMQNNISVCILKVITTVRTTQKQTVLLLI